MTALGNLPSNQPLPVGSVQRKFGGAEAEAIWPPPGYAFYDGAGGNMQITVQPARRCVWVVQANILFRNPAEAWTRVDVSLYLEQADRTGKVEGHREAAAQYKYHGWQSLSLSAMFYPEANTFYRCYILSRITDNQSIYHQAARHLNMFGYTLGEGMTA